MATKITIELDDAEEAGVTWARERFNETVPPVYETVTVGEGDDATTEQRAIEPNPDIIATNEAYMQRTMKPVFESYVDQKKAAEREARIAKMDAEA